MKTRNFFKIFSCLLLLGLALPAFAQGKAPDTVNVLIGFTSPPTPEDVALVQQIGGHVKYVYGLAPAIAASVPERMLAGLQADRHVAYIEPDEVLTIQAQTVPWGIDRVFGKEEGTALRRTTAWSAASDAGTIINVAIVDTGIDASHEDLQSQVVKGRNFSGGNVNNWNDGHGHGTHVAGTVAAVDNNLGVVGVAPMIKLFAAKVLKNNGMGFTSDIIAGYNWAVDEGANVINMSLGGGGFNTTFNTTINSAYAKGVLTVAAAGNSGNSDGTGDNVNYPAKYANAIAVAASDSSDQRASFSSTGPDVELIAPGVGVLSTLPGNKYEAWSGTSMASPHVAGAAALVWAVNPGFTVVELRDLLNSTAESLGLPANHQGSGLVRPDLALDIEPVDPPAEDPPAEDPPADDDSVLLAVSSITYTGSGGPNQNRHLSITIQLDPAVAGAGVSIQLFRDDSLYGSGSGSTGSGGSVTFDAKNVPSGTYTTVFTNISADGYTWDGETPPNSWTK